MIPALTLALTLALGPRAQSQTPCCLCDCQATDQARCVPRCTPKKTRGKGAERKCVQACKRAAASSPQARTEFELARAIAKLDADEVVREIAQRIPGFEVEGDRLTISEKAMRRILLLLEESDLWNEAGKR